MPEDNGPPIPPSGSRGVRQVNVSNAPTRVQVTRIDQQTGQVLDAEHDLLREIKECCEDQTQTLGRKLDEIKKTIEEGGGGPGGGGGDRGDKGFVKDLSEGIKKGLKDEFTRLITQLKTAPGGVSEGEVAAAGESFGAMAAESRTASDRLKNISDLIKNDTTPAFAEWNKLFKAGVVAEWNQAIRQLNFSMQSLASTLKKDTIKFFTGSFKEGMELSRTGLVNLHDVFIDTAGAIAEQRDNIVLTMKSMRAAIDKGLIPPLGTFGTSVKEVGKSFADLRDAIDVEGFKFASAFKSLEDANVALQTLVSADLRAGIRSDIRDAETQRRFATQLEQLRLIGSLNQKQIEEMIAQRQQTDKEFSVLVRQGLISKKDSDQAKLLYDFFIAQGDRDTANQIKLLAETGAITDGLSPAMAAMNDEQRLSTALNREFNQGLIDVIKGGGDLRKMTGELLKINTSIRGQGELAVIQQKLGTKQMSLVAAGVDIANRRQLDKAIEKFEASAKTSAGKADDLVRTFQQHVQKFITPALWSLVVTTGIIAGRMLLGGAGQLFRRLRGGGAAAAAAGGVSGITRAVTPAVATGIPAATAAASRAAPAAAGLLRGAGGFLGKLIPGIGAVISGGLALRAISKGDFLGGLLHAGSGIASFVPGPGTAIAAGLSGLAIGREFLGTPTTDAPGVTPTPTAPTAVATGGSPQRMFMEHMQAQSNYLNRLVTLSEESNVIGRDMRDRIGRPERAAVARESGATGGGAVPFEKRQAIGA